MLEEIVDAQEVSGDEDEGIEMNGEDDASDEEANQRESSADVIKDNTYARNYVYDKEAYLWCELTFNVSLTWNVQFGRCGDDEIVACFQLPMQYSKNIDLSSILKDVARKAVISQVPLINRAITYVQNDEIILKTDGINIVVSNLNCITVSSVFNIFLIQCFGFDL